MVSKDAEEAKVAIRNIRRDGNDDLKKLEKNGEITEDDLRVILTMFKSLQMNHVTKIDEVTKDKEKEIMEV